MDEPKSLKEFKELTHNFYTAYCMSNSGMSSLAEDLTKMEGFSIDGKFQIGPKGFESEPWTELPTKKVLEGMSKDGPFSQLVAHGIIVWIYGLWDEEYRKLIANELGVAKNSVRSDLMGDLRRIRQWIVHCRSVADKEVSKIEVLSWPKTEGPILVTSREMAELQQGINSMAVYVQV